MLSEIQVKEIEEIIGYTFTNKNILNTAFTHSSFSNENPVESNERFEFLGDSILNFLVAEILFDQLTGSEGDLTHFRSKFVSSAPLHSAIDKMNLFGYYQRGRGATREQNLKDKHFADLFEAIVGAIYFDCRDLVKVRMFIVKHLLAYYRDIDFSKDYKSHLQECLQSENIAWQHNTCDCDGGGFMCELVIDGNMFVGKGRSKPESEQNAAKSACEFYKYR